MTNSLSIDEINKLIEQLESHKQMLMDAHFQNKKLADELVIAQNQYNKVVEQNKELQQLAKQQGDSYEYCIQELEKKFEKVLEIAKKSDMPMCCDTDCDCDKCNDEVTENGSRCMQKGLIEIIKVLTTSNELEK